MQTVLPQPRHGSSVRGGVVWRCGGVVRAVCARAARQAWQAAACSAVAAQWQRSGQVVWGGVRVVRRVAVCVVWRCACA